MRHHRFVFVCIALAGAAAAQSELAMQQVATQQMSAAELRIAQMEPAPGVVRQRAPGVPMAPNPQVVAPQDVERPDMQRPRDGKDRLYRTPRDEQAREQRGADRDLPMPRPVPSIITP